MRLSVLAFACILLVCAPPVRAALECTPDTPHATLHADFEREFAALYAADRLRQDEHKRELDGMIARIDAQRGWRQVEKDAVLTTLAQSPEILEQETLKHDLGTRLNAALEAMERNEGDACMHAREVLSLFAQGLEANEKQWSHMRTTLQTRIDAHADTGASR